MMRHVKMKCEKCSKPYAITVGEGETFDEVEERRGSSCDGLLVREDTPHIVRTVRMVCTKCGTPAVFPVTEDISFESDESAEHYRKFPDVETCLNLLTSRKVMGDGEEKLASGLEGWAVSRANVWVSTSLAGEEASRN